MRVSVVGMFVLLAVSCNSAAPPLPTQPPIPLGPPDTGAIWVVVTDEQGSPVTKLDGILVPPGQLLTDDEAPGQIVATSVVGGQYMLFVKAAGYLESELRIDVTPGRVASSHIALARDPTTAPTFPVIEVTDADPAPDEASSVAEAAAAPIGSTVTVRGLLVRTPESPDVWLCEESRPSVPPLCVGARMLVDVDPRTVPNIIEIDTIAYKEDAVVRGMIKGPRLPADRTGN